MFAQNKISQLNIFKKSYQIFRENSSDLSINSRGVYVFYTIFAIKGITCTKRNQKSEQMHQMKANV